MQFKRGYFSVNPPISTLDPDLLRYCHFKANPSFQNATFFQGLSRIQKLDYSASWRSTSAELNRSLWAQAFYCFAFDATMKALYLKKEHNLRSRLRDLFCFLLRKENNLQILAFFINNCLENNIWLSKRSMFFG